MPTRKVSLELVIKDYDYLAPLMYGDVIPEGLDLHIDRVSPITRTTEDPSVPAGELSFSGYLIRLAQGNDSFVGIPFFAYRAFRQRCFFTLRDSGLTDLPELEGKRVGTNAWPDSGNTWSRAVLREAGVAIDQIDWWVGGIDDPKYDSWKGRPEINVPPYVHAIAPGQTLREMLLGGELDALMIPIPPRGLYDAESPIVRVIDDYVSAEKAYYRRTGLYPAHHIVGVRREVFERDPWIARSLYTALDQSQKLWQERRKQLTELTPWLLADVERAMELMGEDWQPNGVEANRKVIATLCEEEFAQGLIEEPLDGDSVFADFETS
jgi:4,5-dihydroxyphthalate decarboxylase